MKIRKTEIEDGGKFYIEEDGDRRIGLMTYKKSGDRLITIDHTEVDSNHRGEGLGEDLVEAGVNFARENDLKIIAACPFAEKVIDEKPEFQVVLAD